MGFKNLDLRDKTVTREVALSCGPTDMETWSRELNKCTSLTFFSPSTCIDSYYRCRNMNDIRVILCPFSGTMGNYVAIWDRSRNVPCSTISMKITNFRLMLHLMYSLERTATYLKAKPP